MMMFNDLQKNGDKNPQLDFSQYDMFFLRHGCTSSGLPSRWIK